MMSLAKLYYEGVNIDKNLGEALKWYEKAANLGNVDAMERAGYMYIQGNGVPCNYQKAMEWSLKAANKGNVDAMFYVGGMFHEGKGVPQDYRKAFEWQKKAAENGHVLSMFLVGGMYETGETEDGRVDYSSELTRKTSEASLRVNEYLKTILSGTFKFLERFVK